MRFRLALLGVLGFVTAVQANELQVGANQITVDHLRHHVETLTDPKLDGRANGSEGAETAARYIEDQFKAVGLKPAGTERYRQGFRVYSGVRVEGVIGLRDLSRGYEFNKDYTPLGLSDDGKQLASLVFAGYGVSAPELGYDDYEGIDVAGKIVLAFLGEPGMQDPDSPFDGLAQTIHSDLYQKAEMAREHGAVGLLLTPGPLYTRDPERVWKISTDVGYRNAGLLIAQLTVSAAQAMVDPAGLDLALAQKEIDESRQPHSAAVDQQVELVVKLRRLETRMTNVVGKVPGRTKDSVVLLANYDGFGVGEDNGHPMVHSSANANATGIAALIEIARAFSKMPQPEKTIYFVALSGHQLSSVGAESLVREAVIPTADVSCAINLFALGVPTEKRLEVFGTDSGEGLGDLIRGVNDQMKDPVVLRIDRDISRSGDHIPFYRAGVPTLTFFGGAYGTYGTPGDTPDIIQYPGFTRNVRYIYGVVQTLAGMEEPVAFHR
ncbi:MAG: M28 family peptidase [Candidatus Eisenbacteria bacterium]|uniref:M28 family peptidase n=1 Tax=Eiseniibacteriota bacterium TaxID=2212470 RepID=A0A956M2N1_UNCEI|nr:M28 family peptidase [Candidatus Eisenbacteria bacterium]